MNMIVLFTSFLMLDNFYSDLRLQITNGLVLMDVYLNAMTVTVFSKNIHVYFETRRVIEKYISAFIISSTKEKVTVINVVIQQELD